MGVHTCACMYVCACAYGVVFSFMYSSLFPALFQCCLEVGGGIFCVYLSGGGVALAEGHCHSPNLKSVSPRQVNRAPQSIPSSSWQSSVLGRIILYPQPLFHVLNPRPMARIESDVPSLWRTASQEVVLVSYSSAHGTWHPSPMFSPPALGH